MTLVDPGDEVLIPIPYWVSYAEQIQLADGVPVYIETRERNSFKLTVDLLNEYVTDKTKLLVLNAQFPIASNSSFVYKSPEGFEGALSTKSFCLIRYVFI